MFAVEIAAIPFYARLSGQVSRSNRRSNRTMNSSTAARPPQALICEALADMVPSTSEEIAFTTGLDPDTTAASLDQLAAGYRVMFNPLTKRFSLPKTRTLGGLAA